MNEILNRIVMFKNLLKHTFIIQDDGKFTITDSLNMILIKSSEPVVPWITIGNVGVDFNCIVFESDDMEHFNMSYIHDLKDGYVHLLFDMDYDKMTDDDIREIIKRCNKCQYGVILKDCNYN